MNDTTRNLLIYLVQLNFAELGRTPMIIIDHDAHCVSKARAMAADVAVARGTCWFASTDTDPVVPPYWLSAQLSHEHAAVCGIIELLRASFLSTSVMAR